MSQNQKRFAIMNGQRTSEQLTIGVTTFQRPHLLQRCLKSLLKQTCGLAVFQVIVHNDSPTFPGYEVVMHGALEAFPNLIWLESNRNGLCNARNKIIKACRTPYLGFCDDDDWFRYEHVQTLLGFMQSQSEFEHVIVSGAIERHHDGSKFLVIPPFEGGQGQEEQINRLITCGVKSNAFVFPCTMDLYFDDAWGVDENFYFQLLIARRYRFVATAKHTAIVECRNISLTCDFGSLSVSKVSAYQSFVVEFCLENYPGLYEYYLTWVTHAIPNMGLRARIDSILTSPSILLNLPLLFRFLVVWPWSTRVWRLLRKI